MDFALKMMNISPFLQDEIKKERHAGYCELLYKCHFLPSLSIENAEKIENVPCKKDEFHSKWPFILQFEVWRKLRQQVFQIMNSASNNDECNEFRHSK